MALSKCFHIILDELIKGQVSASDKQEGSRETEPEEISKTVEDKSRHRTLSHRSYLLDLVRNHADCKLKYRFGHYSEWVRRITILCHFSMIAGLILILRKKRIRGKIYEKAKSFVYCSCNSTVQHHVCCRDIRLYMLCGIEHSGYSAPADTTYLYAILFGIDIIICAILAWVFDRKQIDYICHSFTPITGKINKQFAR